MGTASYLNVIEQYHDNREAIRELMASMVTGIADARLLYDEEAQRRTLDCLNEQYPFVELLFALDESGVQTSDNVSSRAVNGGCDAKVGSGRGKDRSQRPYFLLARESSEVVVTDPYLSSASRDLCLSAALQWRAPDGGVAGYMVVDVSLGKTVEFLMGDTDRRRFQPLFRLVYSLIVLGLMAVVGALLVTAFAELLPLLTGQATGAEKHLKPFGIIIFLTLALAIFDLGKTVLEEEVLMHKDIYRHSSTRRTITRFMAAILIAVSIESLLLMFKSVLGEGTHLSEAVWIMFAAATLLIGLGVYVYLGAQAEHRLKMMRRPADSRAA